MASALPRGAVTSRSSPKRMQCPRCLQSECRVVDGHRCVCRPCSKSLRRVYHYCWACQREWPRGTASNLGGACTLPNCGKRAALLHADTIRDKSSAADCCPFFRACPACTALLTHDGTGCRYITCPAPNCHTEFCFRCLQTECILEEEDDGSYLSGYEDEEPVDLCVIVGNFASADKI
ncbi:uncharacterized protein si:ch211-284e13.9 [Engraulis encrasicolus]|uniref:uncharacterized protein si:ch211-284e13.9 n=1 Tax=Engraulis encrasicolus TaxID=184585 RepID=UPI002FCE9329